MPDFSFDGPGMAPFSRDNENFWYKLSRIILTEPSPYMYVRRLRWASEILNSLEAAGYENLNINNKKFLRICNSIDLNEKDGLEYLKIVFNKIFTTLNIDFTKSQSLNEHYDSFFTSSKARIERLIKEGNPFIGETTNFRKVFKQRQGIKVSTIHGIKREEYDTMIAFALLNDYLPHFNDPNKKENSKKPLYVIASRARKNLHLISEKFRAVHNYHAPEGKIPTPELIKYEYSYDE